jgi:exonuclease SbcC
MKLSKLYIVDFCCYQRAFIDFSGLNSLLIVGTSGENDNFSNGVGKSTIFKAIEFVLFNTYDVNLEHVVRDEMPFAHVVLDFLIGDQEYRLSRKRTRKGTTDLSLFLRNSVSGSDEQIYHQICPDGLHIPMLDEKQQYWKNISGRRTQDTEKDLEKVLKINFKSFRGIVHFVQNDLSGLSTATPEKRKLLLKEVLNLGIYSSLEKITKEKIGEITREIDRCKIILDAASDLPAQIALLQASLPKTEEEIDQEKGNLAQKQQILEEESKIFGSLVSSYQEMLSKCSSLLSREKELVSAHADVNVQVSSYKEKKEQIIKSSKALISDIKNLSATAETLKADFSQISILEADFSHLKDRQAKTNAVLILSQNSLQELQTPLPDQDICPHCRQVMSQEHKQSCQDKINQEIRLTKEKIKEHKDALIDIIDQIKKKQAAISDLTKQQKQLETIETQIAIKQNELSSKKVRHQEYQDLLVKFTNQAKEKEDQLLSVRQELSQSSLTEANKLQEKIEQQKKVISSLQSSLVELNKKLSHLNSTRAVLLHSLQEKLTEAAHQEQTKVRLSSLEEDFAIYPHVLQAFSSSGIPNLIIQTVLDELQDRSNTLLEQLKPGLQISFLVEKTKGDGSEDSTLDIEYFLHGKKRYYEQLSGAMKVSITFALKLGLSHLLQNMFGTDIKFLLLDELDQSLDKASIDAFADIVRHFQQEYTIMVITHNDRLKEKRSVFSHAIAVSQDVNMISTARIVSL